MSNFSENNGWELGTGMADMFDFPHLPSGHLYLCPEPDHTLSEYPTPSPKNVRCNCQVREAI